MKPKYLTIILLSIILITIFSMAFYVMSKPKIFPVLEPVFNLPEGYVWKYKGVPIIEDQYMYYAISMENPDSNIKIDFGKTTMQPMKKGEMEGLSEHKVGRSKVMWLMSLHENNPEEAKFGFCVFHYRHGFKYKEIPVVITITSFSLEEHEGILKSLENLKFRIKVD